MKHSLVTLVKKHFTLRRFIPRFRLVKYKLIRILTLVSKKITIAILQVFWVVYKMLTPNVKLNSNMLKNYNNKWLLKNNKIKDITETNKVYK